jgi:hypothetical protein
MVMLSRVAVAAGYAFSAWLCAGLLIYATAGAVAGQWRWAQRYGGLLMAFAPIYTLYFRGDRPLKPVAAAAVALALIAALDLVLVAPHFGRPHHLFLSFWEWQLPAALVAGSICLAGFKYSSK